MSETTQLPMWHRPCDPGHELSGRQTVRTLLDRPVQVVAGKGGVGRSAVASALALRSSRSHRTLLLECNAPDNCARYLGVASAPDEPREVLNNLWICRMTPQGSLREYAMMILKFKALYNFVFENPLVKYFLRSIPSLGEFTQMGKTWFHSTEKLPNGKPKYERIIIDAPATGHALTLLSVSRVVADTVPKGIMKNAASDMAAMIENESQACLHLVATPEEMPVNEAIELAEAARDRLRMQVGVALINRVRNKLLKDGEREIVERVEGVEPYLKAVRRRLEWEDVESSCIDRFQQRSDVPILQIPEQDSSDIDRAWLERIADLVEERAGD